MKKTIGICFFAVFLAGLIGVVWEWNMKKEDEIEKINRTEVTEYTEEAEEEAAEIMQVQETFQYLILAEDDLLVVYDAAGETIVFETNIRTLHLDSELLVLLQDGIRIKDERELYDFLESYSS